MTSSDQVSTSSGGTNDEMFGKAVFAHSSFRTSSTWLWIAFRRNARARAFYEVFHEGLASLRQQDITANRTDSWNSKHPPTDPYFLEYADSLSNGGGVRGFSADMSFGRFVPNGGLEGRLSPAEHDYLAGLINAAIEAGCTPVLTFCRSLGRVGAIKREFGGWHIFLYRNLFRQWLSYLHQHYTGNSYFLGTVRQVVDSSAHDGFLANLRRQCDLRQSNALGFGGFADLASAFRAFVGLHLYLSMDAFRQADQVIDIDRLSREAGYRSETESRIARNTGLEINLADARISVSSVGLKAYRPADMDGVVRSQFKDAVDALQVGEGTAAYAFGATLAEGMVWAAEDFDICTRGLRDQLVQSLADLEEQRRRGRLLGQESAILQSRLGELDQRIHSFEESTIWRATKPLRNSIDLIRRLKAR